LFEGVQSVQVSAGCVHQGGVWVGPDWMGRRVV